MLFLCAITYFYLYNPYIFSTFKHHHLLNKFQTYFFSPTHNPTHRIERVHESFAANSIFPVECFSASSRLGWVSWISCQTLSSINLFSSALPLYALNSEQMRGPSVHPSVRLSIRNDWQLSIRILAGVKLKECLCLDLQISYMAKTWTNTRVVFSFPSQVLSFRK